VKILDSESSYNKRLISEMIYIKRQKQSLNRRHRIFAWILSIYYSISFSFLISSCLYYSFHSFIHISIPSYVPPPTIFQLILPSIECHFCDFILSWTSGRQDIFTSYRIVSKFNVLCVSESSFISTFDLRYVTLRICIFILTVSISKIKNFPVNIEIKKFFAILTFTNFAEYYLTYITLSVC